MMPVTPISPSLHVFDDDDEGWQDMPVVREDEFAGGLDEEDQKKYHYVPSAKGAKAANATGDLLDVDDRGNDWRSKVIQNESDYTRLRVNEEEDADEVHLRTKYLFDEDKAMTPLSQMQATKNLLTEAQRIAYVGLCSLTAREMSQSLKRTKRKELKAASTDMELWALKIMGRLYYHMEVETQEQKMIESLAEHGVQPMDLVPALMTTHTVANPEYDPEEARKRAVDSEHRVVFNAADDDDESISDQTLVDQPSSPSTYSPSTPKPQIIDPSSHKLNSPTFSPTLSHPPAGPATYQTTARVLEDTSTSAMPGVTTTLSAADENVTLDIRWTVLCDLFLVLIADSVYDARSRVLLENVALKLGLGWIDVVKFESRVTEALEIQEDVETMENEGVIKGRQKAMKNRRYMMLGLATIGGGLVIGLSAGLLAPVIGAGLGAAFTTIGISGTTGFFAGVGGTALITTGGVLTGSGIAVNGMSKRTRLVRTFDILPLHNNKRVSCILTVPGFMNGIQDDVRLPFSVLDPIVGDVFSVLWEPEMIRETGSALKIMTQEVLSQIGLTVLQATVMSALMTALQWPIILTKLGYLIDNPWNNALDRARAAGSVLAEVLINRHLGVRPITLIGFSLGARVIFYALVELAKQKAFGIVQDVFLLGTTVSASPQMWYQLRSVVSGRFVNAYARNDWVLNYLFRASSGGVGTVAGLRPVDGIPGLENIDVTDKIAGHMSYRTFMPLILDQLGFPVSADFFDEPVEPDFTEERIIETEDEAKKKKGWFSRKKHPPTPSRHVSRPPSAMPYAKNQGSRTSSDSTADIDLPPRAKGGDASASSPTTSGEAEPSPPSSDPSTPSSDPNASATHLPVHAGFDLDAIRKVLNDARPEEMKIRNNEHPTSVVPSSLPRGGSAPPDHHSSGTHASSSSLHRDAGPDYRKMSRDNLSDRLSAPFNRSMSLSDVHDDHDDLNDEHSYTQRPAYPRSPQSSHEDTSFVNTPRLSHRPLPLAGDLSWTLSAERDTFSSGLTSISSASPFNNSSHTPQNFAFPPSDNAGLSFGSADGSITGFSKSTDPWQVPWDKGKKAGGFNSNPWT